MTGMRDVTTCADIHVVYGKHFKTQISIISAKNDFLGARTWTCVTRECYTILTSPLHRVNSALQYGKYLEI